MKIFIRIVLVALLLIVAYAAYYLSLALPIVAGYGAKNLCSCVFVAGRDPKQVIAQELGASLVNLGTYEAHFEDSSATGSVLGLSKRKAIYRKGLGCTLISEISEEELRAQKINLEPKPTVNQDSIAWPGGNIVSDSSLHKFPQLANVVDEAFAELDKEKPVNTRAVIIVHNEEIVAEKYAPGFNQNTKLMGWSMTKTITNAMVGMLVKHGKLNVEQLAPVPE
jgi:Beta-lactamase